jgi:hypothetical protein
MKSVEGKFAFLSFFFKIVLINHYQQLKCIFSLPIAVFHGVDKNLCIVGNECWKTNPILSSLD